MRLRDIGARTLVGARGVAATVVVGIAIVVIGAVFGRIVIALAPNNRRDTQRHESAANPLTCCRSNVSTQHL
jgi:hypothetical protein